MSNSLHPLFILFFTLYVSDYFLLSLLIFYVQGHRKFSDPCERKFLGHPSNGGPAKNKKKYAKYLGPGLHSGLPVLGNLYRLPPISSALSPSFIIFTSFYSSLSSFRFVISSICLRILFLHLHFSSKYERCVLIYVPPFSLKSHSTDDIEIDTSFKWKL